MDECKTNTYNCEVNEDCKNIMGSYTCKCKAGYTRAGKKCKGRKQKTEKSSQRNYFSIPWIILAGLIECQSN